MGGLYVEEGFAEWWDGGIADDSEPTQFAKTSSPFKMIHFLEDSGTKSDPMVKSPRKLRERIEALFPRSNG